MNKTLTNICIDTVGPLLFDYVCWILSESRKRGFRTIYFLARDGYLLYRIAEKICVSQNLQINCRYLYCSRASLRLPAYHLIGEEAYDLLLLESYQLSMRSVLERIDMSAAERAKLYNELGCHAEEENEPLNGSQFSNFSDRLRKSPTYRSIVSQKSKEAYPAAIEYLRQEGLFSEERTVIADCGWTGTMQRTLRQLLTSAGYKGSVIGFYFGIYHFYKKETEDGEYHCWYFDETSPIIDQVLFNNILFECCLSAPHGMTKSYVFQSGKYHPALAPPPGPYTLSLIHEQIDAVLQYTDVRLASFSLSSFNAAKSKRASKRLIRSFMIFPSREEAEIYGRFAFCDDISDSNRLPLADPEQLELLKKNYKITPRIMRKLLGRSKLHINTELYWPYGTAAFAKNKLWTAWFRFKVILLEYIRFLVKRQKRDHTS